MFDNFNINPDSLYKIISIREGLKAGILDINESMLDCVSPMCNILTLENLNDKLNSSRGKFVVDDTLTFQKSEQLGIVYHKAMEICIKDDTYSRRSVVYGEDFALVKTCVNTENSIDIIITCEDLRPSHIYSKELHPILSKITQYYDKLADVSGISFAVYIGAPNEIRISIYYKYGKLDENRSLYWIGRLMFNEIMAIHCVFNEYLNDPEATSDDIEQAYNKYSLITQIIPDIQKEVLDYEKVNLLVGE